MNAQRATVSGWLHDDTEEDLVGADWHQRAIRTLADCLLDLATRRGWPWHVGDQLPLVAWRPDGASWRPSPDIMIHPLAGPTPREEIAVRDEGAPALIVEVVSRTTWRYDADTIAGKAAGYAHLGVPEYLLFDPTGEHLSAPCHGWRFSDGAIQEWRPEPNGRYVSAALNIAFSPDGDLLRVYDPDGRPVLYTHEKTERIESQNREIAVLQAELARLRGENTAE